jgi:hypothetical protein
LKEKEEGERVGKEGKWPVPCAFSHLITQTKFSRLQRFNATWDIAAIAKVAPAALHSHLLTPVTEHTAYASIVMTSVAVISAHGPRGRRQTAATLPCHLYR